MAVSVQRLANKRCKMPARARRLGPFSRPNVLAKPDGRTRDARLLRELKAELTAHVGGHPNAVQRRLIDRAGILALRLALLDAIAPDGRMSDAAAKEYICWHNAYVRTLARLGLDPAPAAAPDLAGILATLPASRASTAHTADAGQSTVPPDRPASDRTEPATVAQ